jgi:hypothetical protein
MTSLLTPISISEQPSTTPIELPEYDWNSQTRHASIVAGKHTFHSLQTFDGKGKPNDSTNDNND